MSKRILMIADADSFWTKRYIEHLLLPAGYQVLLFPIWGNLHTNDAFYAAQGIQVYEDRHTLPLIRHVPRLRMWARVALNLRDLRKLGPFQIIHNHYLSQRDLALGGGLAKAFPEARWVCSFWGSDLMRASARQLRQMRPYLRRCHWVTIHSALQEEVVRKAYGAQIAKKTALVYFGQTVFEDIDRARAAMSKQECQEHFGIKDGQRVICVGYNASPAQHQPEVLHALAKMEYMSGVTLVLQMTYGGHNQAYLEEVEAAAAKLPCAKVVLRAFMDGEESAKLRLAADVFILAVQTDSFSASMQEYLYAGAQVLVGGWLSYPQLDELGIETKRFDSYDEIPALTVQVLGQPVSMEQQQRRAQLATSYSWDAVRQGWLALYQ